VSIFVNIGMWFERFVITVTTVANDFLPSSWDYYSPTVVDIFTFVGTFGFFGVLYLLFLRFLPLMAFAEIKAVMPEADPHATRTHGGPSHHHHTAGEEAPSNHG
jgi:molybdopterin-containing oxidoreductase family membrane subunit